LLVCAVGAGVDHAPPRSPPLVSDHQRLTNQQTGLVMPRAPKSSTNTNRS
jgi:hypothetical protein